MMNCDIVFIEHYCTLCTNHFYLKIAGAKIARVLVGFCQDTEKHICQDYLVWRNKTSAQQKAVKT